MLLISEMYAFLIKKNVTLPASYVGLFKFFERVFSKISKLVISANFN